MKKVFVILFLLIGLCAQGVVLKGGVHYTVESAREEAFSRVKYKISMDEHKKYLKDPGFSLDKNGKPKIRTFGRDVTFFSDGEYCVYYLLRCTEYCYDKNGKLTGLIYDLERDYPRLISKYDINGNLDTIYYMVEQNYEYVYDSKKNYLGKWIDSCFYEPTGEISIERFKIRRKNAK